jgi:predicted helicase
MKPSGKINYYQVEDFMTTQDKLKFLQEKKEISNISWHSITPDRHNDWINQRSDEYSKFISFGDKDTKGRQSEALFLDFTIGLKTSKDAWALNFSKSALIENINRYIDNYRQLLGEFKNKKITLQDVKRVEHKIISWSNGVLQRFEKGKLLSYYKEDVCVVQYRPFAKRYGYRNEEIIERQCRRTIFPNNKPNISIATTNVAQSSFTALLVDGIFDQHLLQGNAYPLYVYREVSVAKDSGQRLLDFEEDLKGERVEAITDWALKHFQTSYKDNKISKESIFYYTYAVVSAPEFVLKYEQDARKSGPRLPLLQDFWKFEQIGRDLADLHLNYENYSKHPELTIEFLNDKLRDSDLYKVTKMTFSDNKDKKSIKFNDNIIISNIPEQAYLFNINGRSAIEWVMNQYQVSTDKDTGILNDPNSFSADPKYIFNTVIGVIGISIQTLKIYDEMPKLQLLDLN